MYVVVLVCSRKFVLREPSMMDPVLDVACEKAALMYPVLDVQ